MRMKRLFFLALMIAAGTVSAWADDYEFPYLTFETADGTKVSVSSSSLEITIEDGKLCAGTKSFTLTDLSKMYFSENDETATEIRGVNTDDKSVGKTADICDLQGRKVTEGQMRRGIYVIKTQSGTRKVQVR